MRYPFIVFTCCVCTCFLFCKPQAPQLKSGYDYSAIKAVSVRDVRNYLSAEGSGAAVKQALVKALRGLGFKIVDDDQEHEAVMICSITEYNERRTQPYLIAIEDKGPAPLANMSAYEQADNGGAKGSASVFSSPVTRTREILHTDAFVGIKLRMIDVQKNTDVWSSDFAYSSLDKSIALERCITGALRPLKIILKK